MRGVQSLNLFFATLAFEILLAEMIKYRNSSQAHIWEADMRTRNVSNEVYINYKAC